MTWLLWENSKGLWKWNPHILVDQLTISQSEGADYAHQIILVPPDFHTFLRPLAQNLFFWTVPFPTGSLLDLSAIVKSKTELILKLWGIFGPHILDYIYTFLSAFCFNRRLLKIRRFCSENGKTTWKVMHILEQLPLRAPSLIKHFKLNSLSVEIKYSGNVVFELGTPTNFHFL